MIRCKNGRLYTGITTDVERRFEEHKSNDKKGSKYLRGKAPLILVMRKKIGDKSMALKIEAKVKRLSKIKKELLIDGKIKIREMMRGNEASGCEKDCDQGKLWGETGRSIKDRLRGKKSRSKYTEKGKRCFLRCFFQKIR